MTIEIASDPAIRSRSQSMQQPDETYMRYPIYAAAALAFVSGAALAAFADEPQTSAYGNSPGMTGEPSPTTVPSETPHNNGPRPSSLYNPPNTTDRDAASANVPSSASPFAGPRPSSAH